MLGRIGTRAFSGFPLRNLRSGNTFWAVLACWAAVLLAFAALPAGSDGRMLVAAGASWAAEAFAGVALILALFGSAGAGRLFWALFGGAVFFRYADDLVWTDSRLFGAGLPPAYQAAAGALSYALFFGALLWLARRSRRETTPVAALDAASVMLSSGLLLWFFVLRPATAAAAGPKGWEAFAALAQPTCDLGLFLLGLGVLLTVRSAFATFLFCGLLLLLVTDGAYLALRVNGAYVLGGWPVLLWSGGVALLGVAALSRGSAGPLWRAEATRNGNLGTLLLWLGPLSPPLQYAALLLRKMSHPLLPGYVLLCGAALLAVLALRVYIANHVGGVLAGKLETSTRRLEQRRILGELHDTAKQNVRGASMMIEACREAHARGDQSSLSELLDRSLEMTREAGRQLSKPLDELGLSCGEGATSPTALLKERFEEFGKDFGLATRQDIEAPLEVLSPRETSAAHRVCTEAFWNVVNHAGARNLWLGSRREGRAFVLEVRDDGRGFRPEEASEGLGLSLMRSRAEEVGAALDVVSAPGEGTTVRLRFGTR